MMLMRETKEELNKWILWIRRLNIAKMSVHIAKMSVLSELIYRSNAILTKIPERFFCRYRQDYSEIYMGR